MAGNFLAQNQELRQEQILAPQQMQSLEMLLTPLLELQEKLSHELDTNPIIEQEKNAIEELTGDPLQSADKAADAMDSSHVEDENNISDLLQLADSWHDYLPPVHSRSFHGREDEEKRDFMFNSLVEQPSLQEQLLEQLRMTDSDAKTMQIAENVIGSIDESGYLKTHPADIAIASESDLNEVEKAIKLVQTFEPPGIGARDLKECLLLQMERKYPASDPLFKLVNRHLEDIGRNHLPQVAKAMHISLDELKELTTKLKDLNPFPGSSISPSQPIYAIPEITVYKDNEGKYLLQANDSCLPRLKISQLYLDLLEDPNSSEETKSYIKEKLVGAKMLLKSLDQRQSTIRRIAQVIVDSQYDFLENGIESLRPLTMQQVADKLDLHETTISRAIANKYLQTPAGLFEFKFFFSGGYQAENGEEISSRGIKEKIKDMIAMEDSAKPLSDNKISQLLKEDGLNVARRTIAKYREALGIQPSNLRKEYS